MPDPSAPPHARPRLDDGDAAALATLRKLASRRARDGDLAGARQLLDDASEAGKRLGGADPQAVMLAFDLAVVARAMGDEEAARAAFARVVRFGPAGDPAVAQAHAYLTGGAPAASPAEPPRPPGPGAPPSPSAPASPGAPTPGALVGTPVIAGRRRRRTAPLLAAAAAVLAVVVVVAGVLLVRRGGEPTAVVAGPPATSAAPVLPAPGASPPVAASPGYGAAPTPTAPTPTALTPTGAASSGSAAGPSAAASPSNRANPAPATRTRIVSPAAGSRVPWPFTARFAVSDADARAGSTVLSLSICIAGRCYLDGRLSITGGTAAPYAVRLGSTRPEATGQAWTIRLDRISEATYARLVSERDTRIANGSWGNLGTTTSALNSSPVSSLTVVKSP